MTYIPLITHEQTSASYLNLTLAIFMYDTSIIYNTINRDIYRNRQLYWNISFKLAVLLLKWNVSIKTFNLITLAAANYKNISIIIEHWVIEWMHSRVINQIPIQHETHLFYRNCYFTKCRFKWFLYSKTKSFTPKQCLLLNYAADTVEQRNISAFTVIRFLKRLSMYGEQLSLRSPRIKIARTHS